MAEIRTNRWQALLRQIFSLTEPYAPTLISDVMPVFSLEDPSEAHLQLGREAFNVFGGAVVTPAAADVATVDLGPAQALSRTVLDVEFLSLTTSGALAFVTVEHIGLGSSGPGTVTQLVPLDGRRLGSEIHPPRSMFGFTGQIAGFAVPAPTGFSIAMPVAIPFRATLYRSSLRFKANAVNVPLRVAIFGTERVVEPSEERSRVSSAP